MYQSYNVLCIMHNVLISSIGEQMHKKMIVGLNISSLTLTVCLVATVF